MGSGYLIPGRNHISLSHQREGQLEAHLRRGLLQALPGLVTQQAQDLNIQDVHCALDLAELKLAL